MTSKENMIEKIFSHLWIPVIKFSRLRLFSRMNQAFAKGDRYSYQRKLINFDIPPGASVLDIGSGPAPFPHATVLCERYFGNTVHRHGEIRTNGLPIIEGDIHALPFKEKEFDFVYCAHVLEHINDPIKACKELMRVAKRGYLETPNFMKDALFCQAAVMNHRWHTVAVGQTLFFFEYSPRELEGIRSSVWNKMMWSRFDHPLQESFINNQDIFNTMFLWKDKFDVQVITQDGKIART